MKSTQPITKEQIKKLHVLLNQMHLIEHKPLLVFQYTRERTEHCSEMTIVEAKALIQHLSGLSKTDQAAERMRKKVFALAYIAGIIWGETPADKKMNAIKLSQFLEIKGTIRKPLNKMNNQELVKTVTQFEQIIKHKQNTVANKATRSVLEELNIPIAKK